MGRSSHAVQFYEQDEFLFETIADFLAEGVNAGEPGFVIATADHRDGLLSTLHARGIHTGRITFLDAHDTLSAIRNGGTMPDATCFEQHIGRLLRNSPGRIRAYGEMVDVLWRDGESDAAIRLEELWSELARTCTFSLLCAYSMNGFSDSVRFGDVCRQHDRVFPVESSKELRIALAARREAEALLSDFAEHATVGLHCVGRDGKILWANEAELKLLGYTATEYIGRSIAEFHADRDVIDDILRRLSAREEIRDYEARLLAKDGSIRHVAITSNARFESGELVHTRCFTRDITERKRVEEDHAFLLDATTRLNRSLDYDARLREVERLAVPRLADTCSVEIVRDDATLDRDAAIVDPATMRVPLLHGDRILGILTLTHADSGRRFTSNDVPLAMEFARRAASALENAHLYQLAQQANRAKDEFLATLSHELRTPLTAILGWARMLTLGTPLDPETTRVALDTIERSARSQAALIDDLLDLSKIVTGKMSLRTESVGLASVVEGAVQTLRLAADAKAIQIEVSITRDASVVIGDATRLQQIVWNLLSNAIKFTDNGGVVTVTMTRIGEIAQIVVSDTGCGISPEFLPHVFEAFRQADGATTRVHGGLGLGLAVVKYLTELHCGEVSAISRGEGTGATFVVTLPLAVRRTAHETDARDDVIDLHGTSVLVVDDDADSRDLVTAILQRFGADVRTASSVRLACDAMRERAPNIVVSDIAMPIEDGLALLRHVKDDVPVVALTAVADSDAPDRLRNAGFRAYLRKPVDPMHFARVIADLR